MAGLETGFHSQELFLGGGGEAVGRKPPANRTMETSLLTAARVLRTTDAPFVSSAPTCADPVFNADVLEPVARRSPRRGICNAIKPVGPPLAAAAAAAAREASPLAAGGARAAAAGGGGGGDDGDGRPAAAAAAGGAPGATHRRRRLDRGGVGADAEATDLNVPMESRSAGWIGSWRSQVRRPQLWRACTLRRAPAGRLRERHPRRSSRH